ncbi:MAG TPA: DnaB-like helicase N-terminal domain-containing protein [Pyrinomonadaceae bacterium]|jgi:replicative DNA helicase|nr:DnaB-like helicase N-terminal domain-containing protein [Pyrinomonadaceae bacterium]
MNSDQMLERPLPHNTNSERAVLGAIILDNSLVSQAIELLRPDDFYVRAHQFVFRAMMRMSERDAEINPILLAEELYRDGLLEQVGGIPFISELTFGLPHTPNLSSYAKLLVKKATSRRLIKVTDKFRSEAIEEEDEPLILLERMRESLAALDEEYGRRDSGARGSFLTSFAEFMSADFEDDEEIAFHARRGELVLVQSVTNHGKSTLIRNAALTLPTGGEFLPVVARGEPRRVLLLNFEGSAGWFQSDLRAMTRDFTGHEFDLLRKNFFPTHAPVIDGEPLSLSHHMRLLDNTVRRAGGVDVIIIDTISAAFSLRNENDNAEVANYVMKPLVRLARKLNCLIVLVHHVGKAKAEEGASREQAHRGRGASAWGDFSTSIFNLDADAQDQERVTITCGKRKNGRNYERVLHLDRDRRWFKATDETPVKPVTNDDLVLEAMENIGHREMQTAEILSAVSKRVKTRTAMACLNRLTDLGKVSNPRRGWWKIEEVCADCATPYRGLHNCTNSIENKKPLQQADLAVRNSAPLNGNGVKGAGHVEKAI